MASSNLAAHEVEKIIQSIMSGRNIAIIKNKQDQDTTVSFSPPSIEERVYLDFIYETELKKALSYRIPTEKEIIDLAKKNGVWTDYEDNYINKFNEIIEYSKTKAKEAVSTIARKNIEKQIKQAESNRQKIQEKYHELLNRSAESIAREAQIIYLVSRITKTLDGQFLWANINNSQDQVLIWNTVKAYHDVTAQIDLKLIRQIARSSSWRLRWNISKDNCMGLFGRHVRDLSDIQTSLIYWSQVYDSAYQSMDCPQDDVFQNDEKFDQWLEEQSAKRKTERINKELDKKRSDGFYDNQGKFHGRSASVNDHHEYGECVTGYYDKDGYYRDYTPEEKQARIAAIYGRNNIMTRRILAGEVNKIEQKGMLKDQELRNEKTLTMLGSPMTKGK